MNPLIQDESKGLKIYYTEYPFGEFTAPSDEIALQISTAKVIYRESDSLDGKPFIILRKK